MKNYSIQFLAVFTAFILVAGCDAPATHAGNNKAKVVSKKFTPYAPPSGTLTANKIVGACSLEGVVAIADGNVIRATDSKFELRKDTEYRLSGFATNTEKAFSPKMFKLILEGQSKYSIEGQTGNERPDVGAYFKDQNFVLSGYQLEANFGDVASGSYLAVIVYVEGSEEISCPTFQTITVIK